MRLILSTEPFWMGSLLACAFFAAVFIQSSLDKVFDRKGNLAWLTGFFGKTPLRGMVPFLLSALTLLELASGFGCAAAVVSLLLGLRNWLPQIAMSLVCLNFVALVFGQRIAKEYAGAASTAGYFAAALVGLLFTSL